MADIKFQVWVNDNILIGHLIGYTKDEARAYKEEYAHKVFDEDIKDKDISLCCISPNYYDELYKSSDFMDV